MDTIKPIFRDLRHPDLLHRCPGSYTQNANKSINSLIWKYCPKTKFYGLQVTETAVVIAVTLFNDSAGRIKDILQKMDITAGSFTCCFLEDEDSQRMWIAQRQAFNASNEYRIAQRLRRLGREAEMAELEGYPYQAGGY